MHYPANIIIPTAAILLAVLGSVEAFREHHVDHYLHDDDEDEDAKIHLPVYRISTTGKPLPSYKAFFPINIPSTIAEGSRNVAAHDQFATPCRLGRMACESHVR